MADYCIPKNVAAGVKEIFSKVGIEKMYSMSSAERRALFKDTLGEQGAKELNLSFEKAIASNKANALRDWAEKAFNKKEISKTAYEGLRKKLDTLQKMNIFSEADEKLILEDLAMDKLGVNITDEQIRFITAKADKMDKILNVTDADGNVVGQKKLSPLAEDVDHTIEYLREMVELETYIKSLNPNSRLDIAISTIGRGNMIAAIKSTIVNITNNLINSVADRTTLRLTYGAKAGGSKLKDDYIKNARRIYEETGAPIKDKNGKDTGKRRKNGVDVSRLIDLSQFESQTLGEKISHSEGPGAIRAVGRFYEDKIFNPFLSAPKLGGDVAFSTSTFGNSAQTRASAMARDLGYKGKALESQVEEILKDAYSLSPKTDEGFAVRMGAVADATKTTLTDKKLLSTLGLELREAIDHATEPLGFKAGTALAPFVKTPSNAIQRSLESSGLGFVSGIIDIAKLKKSGTVEKGAYRDAARKIVETGGFITGAWGVSQLFEADDFMGSFDPRRKDIDQLKNVSYNAVKIKTPFGDKWVSLDYFGPLAAPFTGFMYAKKYGDSPSDKMFMYGKGVVSQFYRFPLIGVYEDAISGIKEIKDPNNTKEETGAAILDTVVDFVTARIFPATQTDVAKAMDNYERKATSIGENIIVKIPILRNDLEPARDIMGNKRELEKWWSTMLFGARVKTARQNEIIDEVTKLDYSGNMPTITDFRNSKSTRIAQITEKMNAEEKEKAATDYDELAKENILTVIRDESYRDLSDEEKKDEIDHAIEVSLSEVLYDYGYEKPLSKRTNYIVR